MHPPGDGCFGDAEYFGGLGMGQLLPGDEHGGIAQRRLQARDGALQPCGVIGIAAVGRGGKAGQHRQPVSEGAERTAAAAPVAAGVEGDAVEPSREPGFAAIGGEFFDQGAADILGDVVSVGARAGQLPGEAVDAVVMAFEQLGECVAVAGAGGGDEAGILITTDIRPLGASLTAELHIASFSQCGYKSNGVARLAV